MIERLNTDRSIAPIVAQFVPLKVDTDGGNFGAWANKYRHEGNAIPILYVVRANGELAYAKSGSKQGDELPRFLLEHLATAGTIFNDVQLAALKTVVEEAKSSLAGQDPAAAVRRFESVRKLGPLGKLGSHATVAKEADALYLELVELGRSTLAKAQEQLASDEPFNGVLGVVASQRVYGKLPELKKELKAAEAELNRSPKWKDEARLAELLDRALLQAETKEAKPGAKPPTAGLTGIVTKFPGTPAAKLAAAKLTELGAEVPAGTTAAAQGVVRTWSDASGKFRVEAQFVELADGKVRLQRTDGQVISVPLDRLSPADQAFVAEQK